MLKTFAKYGQEFDGFKTATEAVLFTHETRWAYGLLDVLAVQRSYSMTYGASRARDGAGGSRTLGRHGGNPAARTDQPRYVPMNPAPPPPRFRAGFIVSTPQSLEPPWKPNIQLSVTKRPVGHL